MREPWPDELERCRILQGSDWASNPGDPYGSFQMEVTLDAARSELRIIANRADRTSAWWEHVSVSTPDRCPTWAEMCVVKALFWKEDELVVPFHPRKIAYMKCHTFTLHMCRPTRHKDRMPVPPTHLVGPK